MTLRSNQQQTRSGRVYFSYNVLLYEDLFRQMINDRLGGHGCVVYLGGVVLKGQLARDRLITPKYPEFCGAVEGIHRRKTNESDCNEGIMSEAI